MVDDSSAERDETAVNSVRDSNRVPPLNMTGEERRTLLHCILAGEDDAIDHFGGDEAERIQSLKDKLGYPLGSDES